MRASRRLRVVVDVVVFVVPAALVAALVGGADCVPQSGIAEAADCCDCLGDFAADGGDASFTRGNCLPTLDGIPNLGVSDERQVCAEASGRSMNGGGAVDVVAACLQEGHPCADVCARAAEVGVVFDPHE